MNRARKEEIRKHEEARKGLSGQQIRELDAREALECELMAIAQKIHGELFPEEYDFTFDSSSDVKDRRLGINPMSTEYTEHVNARRAKLGVPPLGSDGMATDRSSWNLAYAEAEKTPIR